MRSGCCRCTWCGHEVAGEFMERRKGRAHYRCGSCHLWYSHEIADLEDEERVELSCEEFMEVGR